MQTGASFGRRTEERNTKSSASADCFPVDNGNFHNPYLNPKGVCKAN